MWKRRQKSPSPVESSGTGFASEFQRVYEALRTEGPTDVGDLFEWGEQRFGPYQLQSPHTEALEWRMMELNDLRDRGTNFRLFRIRESTKAARVHRDAPAVFLPLGLALSDEGGMSGPYDKHAVTHDAHLPLTLHDPGPAKIDALITLWLFARELDDPRAAELGAATVDALESVPHWHVADDVKQSWARGDELRTQPVAGKPSPPTSGLQGRVLPPGVVQALERCGRQARYGQIESDAYGPYLPEIEHASLEQQQRWLAGLADAVLPVGGWAVYGAAETVVTTLGTRSVEIPEACAIVDASLEFQRESGVWLSQLSIFEKMHWESRHPGEAWLTTRPEPPRENAPITPIPAGEERKVAVMSRVPDSNEIYVAHTVGGEYVAIVDMPRERGEDRGRVRQENDSAEALYELYCIIGRSVPLPNHWNDPELEPFFPFPTPRI